MATLYSFTCVRVRLRDDSLVDVPIHYDCWPRAARNGYLRAYASTDLYVNGAHVGASLPRGTKCHICGLVIS
jgi:hypothetical protein